MTIATYDAINVKPLDEPPKLRIGYDTTKGTICVTQDGGQVIAYLEPRESREMARNILALPLGKKSESSK